MPSLTGGCLCGRIRYAAAGEPIRSSISIAETASVYTGSAFEPFAMFPTASVTVAGELELSNTMANSGRSVCRCFCPNCGSGVISVDPTNDVTLIWPEHWTVPPCFSRRSRYAAIPR